MNSNDLWSAVMHLDEEVGKENFNAMLIRVGSKAKPIKLSSDLSKNASIATVKSFIKSDYDLYNKEFWGLGQRDSICAVAGVIAPRLKRVIEHYKL